MTLRKVVNLYCEINIIPVQQC